MTLGDVLHQYNEIGVIMQRGARPLLLKVYNHLITFGVLLKHCKVAEVVNNFLTATNKF